MWDENIDIEKEIEEAQQQSKLPEVQCYHPPKEHFAIVFGRSEDEELNSAVVERLHSYLRIHGWEQSLDGGKMKTQRARRTLSKVKTDHNKPETERIYYFNCWFDSGVPILEEFEEVKALCNTHEVDCDHQPDLDSATIVGRGAFADQNKKDVECVRSRLLTHGWAEEEQ
jgi:hypothetical protein